MSNTNKQLPTQGKEWNGVKNHYCFIIKTDKGDEIIINSPLEYEESKKIYDQILSAINNTYGKGINPEAVPEMFELCKIVHDVIINNDLGNDEVVLGRVEQLRFLELILNHENYQEALKKAEL